LIDIHHAGTAMRFLTAYFAVQKIERLLTRDRVGCKSAHQNFSGSLLEQLGAQISYLENWGFHQLKCGQK
jgi:3-phosphoshikimate 1-carboxyvinyltransferase